MRVKLMTLCGFVASTLAVGCGAPATTSKKAAEPTKSETPITLPTGGGMIPTAPTKAETPATKVATPPTKAEEKKPDDKGTVPPPEKKEEKK